MARKLRSDKVVFTATLLLLCAGVVMVYSATAILAVERFERPNYTFLARQGLWIVLGLVVLGTAMRVDYRLYRAEWFVRTFVGAVVLMLIAVFFSDPVNGAHRWFGIGGMGIQPGELAKLAVILFVAVVLERRMHRINDVKYSLTPIALVVGTIFLLVNLQPDLGTAVLMALVTGVMVFAAGLQYRHLIAVAAIAAPVLYLVLVSYPYRLRRLFAFWDPWADPLGEGFQIIQSLIAVGTGGVTGLGLMRGVQKLFYLPEPHTDFIFAVIGEELGLIGATAVLVCFGVIAWRGLRIAARAEDPFGAFLALGITTMIAAQAVVNMSVVLALAPTKGIPLPLVSAGGSSLIVSLAGIGVLLNISQRQVARA